MLTYNRHIAHFDLDTFFVSVECLRNSSLAGKPVLVGGEGSRGVVASCSYEARKFGIHSAMPMKIARRLCPHATVVRGDHEAYSRYSRLVTEVIRDTVPLFEKSSIDEFYIDLSGMDRFFGSLQYTRELHQKIKEHTGLPVSWALASNKLISKVATNEVKPKGQIEIPGGNERSYLAPLSVLKLPGVGKQTGYQLTKMGVETIRLLSEIPVEMLHNLLGKTGIELWRKARGIDESPVVPYSEQRSISTESTFSQDTIDINFLHTELVRMTEKLGFELRRQNRLTGCITVKLRYADFETFTRQLTIPYTNADHHLLKYAKELFTKLHDRRLLVRLIGLRFTHLIPGSYQIHLFDDTEENIRLYQAIDSAKKQFGEGIIRRGSSLPAADAPKRLAAVSRYLAATP